MRSSQGSETILPAGGIGPLTALATEVRYSAEPYFLVTYRDKKQLSGFRLEIEKELKRPGVAYRAESDEDSLELISADASADQLASSEEPDAFAVRDSADVESTDSKVADTAFMELRKQLTQLITGDQFATLPLPEILTEFRAILGVKNSDANVLSPGNQLRIESAAQTIAARNPSEPTRYAKSEIPDRFDALFQDHVSGHLAPLIERIEVGYPASALRNNVVLVDLPGVGIANDRYRSVTTEYIRVKASAVILLVDRAGPTEASVDLIRDSGYWDRLLLSSADPERDPFYGRCFGTSGSVRITGTFPYEMRGVTVFTEVWNDSLARVRMSGNAYRGAWNTVTDSFTGAPDQSIDLTLATHRTAGGYTEVGSTVVSAPVRLRYVARRVSRQMKPVIVACAGADDSDTTRPDWCAESGWGTFHCETGTCLETWHKSKAPASGEDLYAMRLGHGYVFDRVVVYADVADLTFNPSLDPTHVTFRVRWHTTRVGEKDFGSYMFAVTVTGPQGVSP